MALSTIALVVVIVGTLVLVKVTGGGGSNGSVTSPPAGTPVAKATLSRLASIPLSTLAAASTSNIVTPIQHVGGAALTADGKPEVLYIGAEYCPFCAAERWAMYVSLSKFGTFKPEPGQIHSAVRDGDVPTLTFYGTTYSSPYLSFVAKELYTNQPSGDSYVPLQTLTPAQQNLLLHATGSSTSYPFVDFGGTEVLSGAQFEIGAFENQSFSNVASQIGNNSTTVGDDIDSGSKLIVQELCTMTHDQPARVCSQISHG